MFERMFEHLVWEIQIRRHDRHDWAVGLTVVAEKAEELEETPRGVPKVTFAIVPVGHWLALLCRAGDITGPHVRRGRTPPTTPR